MGWSVIKHEDQYLIWSSIVDAPITYGMSRDELVIFWTEEFGRSGKASLDRWLARPQSIDDELVCNRAGKNESKLTKEQIIDFYFVRKPQEEDSEPPMGTYPEHDE